MINTNTGFTIGSNNAIDSRIVLTKAEMISVNDNTQPDVYFAVCKDDGALYIYNKTNEIDLETGKFRIAKNGSYVYITQEEYNIMAAAGTLDPDTVYYTEGGDDRVWVGTRDEYDKIAEKNKSIVYIVNENDGSGEEGDPEIEKEDSDIDFSQIVK